MSATVITASVATTDDLSLLDDIRIHAWCVVCPGSQPQFGEAYTALCGQRSIRRQNVPPGVVPDGACRDCARHFPTGCPKCGAA